MYQMDGKILVVQYPAINNAHRPMEIDNRLTSIRGTLSLLYTTYMTFYRVYNFNFKMYLFRVWVKLHLK